MLRWVTKEEYLRQQTEIDEIRRLSRRLPSLRRRISSLEKRRESLLADAERYEREAYEARAEAYRYWGRAGAIIRRYGRTPEAERLIEAGRSAWTRYRYLFAHYLDAHTRAAELGAELRRLRREVAEIEERTAELPELLEAHGEKTTWAKVKIRLYLVFEERGIVYLGFQGFYDIYAPRARMDIPEPDWGHWFVREQIFQAKLDFWDRFYNAGYRTWGYGSPEEVPNETLDYYIGVAYGRDTTAIPPARGFGAWSIEDIVVGIADVEPEPTDAIGSVICQRLMVIKEGEINWDSGYIFERIWSPSDDMLERLNEEGLPCRRMGFDEEERQISRRRSEFESSPFGGKLA